MDNNCTYDMCKTCQWSMEIAGFLCNGYCNSSHLSYLQDENKYIKEIINRSRINKSVEITEAIKLLKENRYEVKDALK